MNMMFSKQLKDEKNFDNFKERIKNHQLKNDQHPMSDELIDQLCSKIWDNYKQEIDKLSPAKQSELTENHLKYLNDKALRIHHCTHKDIIASATNMKETRIDDAADGDDNIIPSKQDTQKLDKIKSI